jgi:hypothetical protein
MKPPASFDPGRASEIVVYSNGEHTNPVLRLPDGEDRVRRVEYFSGRIDEIPPRSTTPATIVDQVTFMTDRNNYVQILKAQRDEERQLDEENQDLCAGDVVLALPALVVEQARTALDMWTDYHVRPDDWIPLLTNRRKLWRKKAAVYKIEKPARDVGKSFRLLGSHDRRPLRAEWHHVRRKF